MLTFVLVALFTACSNNDKIPYYFNYKLFVVDQSGKTLPNTYVQLRYVHEMESSSDSVVISQAKSNESGVVLYSNLYAGQYEAVHIDSLNNMKESRFLFTVTGNKIYNNKGTLTINN